MRLAAAVCAGVVLTLSVSCGSANDEADTPFERVRLSVVFIETELGFGSGVVFDDEGHIVTNYHVIEGEAQTDVVLPDGKRVEDVSVVGFDRQADIAVLVLPEEQADGVAPIVLGSASGVSVGDRVFAVGYPSEGGTESPVVQLTAGIVSAKRPSVLGDVDYLQTDASFNPGLSGGAFVDDEGELIGMPTWLFNQGSAVGLAITVEDVAEIAGELISSERQEEALDSVGGRLANGNIIHPYDGAGFQVRLEEGEDFGVSVLTVRDAALTLVDPYGYEVGYADDLDEGGREVIEYQAEDAGPHTVVVVPFGSGTRYTVSASHDLRRFQDPEDGGSLEIGESFVGELQFPADQDTMELDLDEGDRVEVTLRSWDFDAFLIVRPPGVFAPELTDDDSGLGFSGTDGRIEFEASRQGTHEIVISYTYPLPGAWHDMFLPGRGFYRLDVASSP